MSNPPTIAVTSIRPQTGKTTVMCAAAAVLRQAGVRVGVMIPAALNGRGERAGYVSPDAELLAHFADAPENLDTISPYVQPDNQPPAEVLRERLERHGPGGSRGAAADGDEAIVGFDPLRVLEQHRRIAARADIVLVELHGGLSLPLAHKLDQADLLGELDARLLLLAPAPATSLEEVLLMRAFALQRGLNLAGILLNRYEPDRLSKTDELSPDWIERYAAGLSPTVIPPGPDTDLTAIPPRLDPEIVAAIGDTARSWLDS